jgi:transcriptional regulator with XRE-family HTH domain
MLCSLQQCNERLNEVDVSTPALYKLVSADLLRTLMQRTGTGAAVSVRKLADKAGVPHGTIGNLLTGDQESVIEPTARRIAGVIGVDVLVLFIPMERAEAATASRPTLAVTA